MVLLSSITYEQARKILDSWSNRLNGCYDTDEYAAVARQIEKELDDLAKLLRPATDER